MNLLLSTNADDSSFPVDIPFSVNFLGSMYTQVYIGSHSYATFGSGSSVHSGLGPSNPPIPCIHMNSGDRSYQRIYTITEPSEIGWSFRVRFEGSASTSGVAGSPNMVWELIFYRDYPGTIDVVHGLTASGGANGVTKGNKTSYEYQPPTANTSYQITTV